MYRGFRDLKVYQLAYQLAMEVFNISKKFPPEERYSLTDQIRRSSRSICTNLAEAYRKRQYSKHFVSKVSDADCEASETLVWIDFALGCDYIDERTHNHFKDKYEEVGKMLGSMMDNPDKFSPR